MRLSREAWGQLPPSRDHFILRLISGDVLAVINPCEPCGSGSAGATDGPRLVEA